MQTTRLCDRNMFGALGALGIVMAAGYSYVAPRFVGGAFMRPRKRLPLLRSAGLAVMILLASAAARATTINVTTSADESPSVINGNCSLREAITAVNTQQAVDACPAGDGAYDVIYVGARTIVLKETLTVLREAFVIGAGYQRTKLEGNGAALYPLKVGDQAGTPGALYLSNVTIQNFTASGIVVYGNAFLSLDHSKIINTGDSVIIVGGCIYNAGIAYVNDSELRGCKSFRGAGIANTSTGVLGVSDTTIAETQGETGGAILNNGELTVLHSTIAKNTVSVRGAGILSTNYAYLEHVTIAHNSSTQRSCSQSGCGALYNSGGTLEVWASIVAKNTAGSSPDRANCSGDPIMSWGYNLLGDPAAPTCEGRGDSDIMGDPLLITTGTDLPTAAGGVGRVYVPSASSPVLRRVPRSVPNSCIFNDQRGVTHAYDPVGCDIGAVERGSALFVVGNQSALGSGDQRVWSRLDRLGFDVTVEDDDTATASSALGKTVVVVSESVSPTVVAAKFRDVSAGVLSMEPGIYDDLKMTGTTSGTHFGSTASQTSINIRSDSQFFGPRVGYFGRATVTSSAQTFAWGVPGSPSSWGLSREATLIGSSSRFTIFGSWESSTMVDGFVAPGQRVAFFASQATSAALTTLGWRFFEEAVLMAAY
jgi:CSLREA domain-containing protein